MRLVAPENCARTQKSFSQNRSPERLFYFDGHSVCDKFRGMPMTEDELRALRLLLREELQNELKPFRKEVQKRFDEIASQMDGVYQRDEKRELEYLSIREQIKRIEQRFA